MCVPGADVEVEIMRSVAGRCRRAGFVRARRRRCENPQHKASASFAERRRFVFIQFIKHPPIKRGSAKAVIIRPATADVDGRAAAAKTHFLKNGPASGTCS